MLRRQKIVEEDANEFYVLIDSHIGTGVIKLTKEDGKWRESTIGGDLPSTIGGKTYMSYLKPNDILSWLRRDYDNVRFIHKSHIDEYVEFEDDENECGQEDCSDCTGCD